MKVSWFRVTMLLRKHSVSVMLVAQSFLTVTLLCFLHRSDVILCRYYKATSSSKVMGLTGGQNSEAKHIRSEEYSGAAGGRKISLMNTAGKEFIVPFQNVVDRFNFENKLESIKDDVTVESNEDVYINDEHKDSFKDNEQQGGGNEEDVSETDDESQQGEEPINEQPIEENPQDEQLIVEQPMEEIQENQQDEQLIVDQPIEDIQENQQNEQLIVEQPIEEIQENQQDEQPIVEQPIEEIQENQQDEQLIVEQPIEEIQEYQQDEQLIVEQPIEAIQENQQDEQLIVEQPIETIQENQQDEQLIVEQPTENQQDGMPNMEEQVQESQQQMAPIEQPPPDDANEVKEDIMQLENQPFQEAAQDNEAYMENYPKNFMNIFPEARKEPENENVQQQFAPVQENVDHGQEPVPEEQQQLPSLYKVYSQDIVMSGLSYEGSQFILNGLPFRILSGAIHYFRVPQDYWRDRLRKLRASGLNTVETYVAWNIHEEVPGSTDFVSEGKNLRKFLALAKEEDLFVILRPGPYICAEWEFGGIPSWILRNDSVRVRSTHPAYLEPALNYIKALSQKVKNLQWSKEYGPQPIIGVQIENEYPIFPDSADIGRNYINILKTEMEKGGLNLGMFFVSNPIRQVTQQSLFDDVLQTINFGNLPVDRLNELKSLQPNKPLMVMEFWTGWFDNWLEPHKKFEVFMFKKNLQGILSLNASLNLYMFHGGTNFGFMNGAYIKKDKVSYRPVVSSYDYDAIVSESGSYTSKYFALKAMLQDYPFGPKTFTPEPPTEMKKVAYLQAHVRYYCPLEDILQQLAENHRASFHVSSPVPMEMLDRVGLHPQSYGFILYQRKNVFLKSNNVLRIKGFVKDILYILINGKLVTKPLTPQDLGTYPPYFDLKDPQINIEGPSEDCQLDLLVENTGRMNVGGIHQERKGITGRIILNDAVIQDWAVFPLEFHPDMFPNEEKWLPFPPPNDVNIEAPALYKATFEVPEDAVCDTFINLSQDNWNKGQIFINNFNLGRYWNLGPTKTSYVPAPLLNKGKNQIYIFELFQPGRTIQFDDHPTLG